MRLTSLSVGIIELFHDNHRRSGASKAGSKHNSPARRSSDGAPPRGLSKSPWEGIAIMEERNHPSQGHQARGSAPTIHTMESRPRPVPAVTKIGIVRWIARRRIGFHFLLLPIDTHVIAHCRIPVLVVVVVDILVTTKIIPMCIPMSPNHLIWSIVAREHPELD